MTSNLNALVEATRNYLAAMKTAVTKIPQQRAAPSTKHNDDIRRKPVPNWPGRRSYIRR